MAEPRRPRPPAAPPRPDDARAATSSASRSAASTAAPRSPAPPASPTTSPSRACASCKLVRSTVPHARIARDRRLRGARRCPGVLGFLTGAGLARSRSASCRSRRTSTPSAPTRCASSAIRWWRSPPSPRTRPTRRRCAVRVEYEPLPTIAAIEEALATPEPRIHDYGDHGNLHKIVSMALRRRRGGLRRGRRDLRGHLLLRGQHPPAAWSSTPRWPCPRTTTGSPSTPRPRRRTTCTARSPRCSSCRPRASASSPAPNGGGFGGKSDPFNHEIVAAKMALKLGRPVKITLTREEVFYCHRGRHPGADAACSTGVKRDGRPVRSPPSTCRPRSTAAPTAATASPRPTTPARSRP